MSSRIHPDEIAVVVPVYRDHILEVETYALRHLNKYLGQYPTYIIAPAALSIPSSIAHLPVERFDVTYFSSIDGYNKLLLSKQFYERFTHFEYMLIHQLDALVFSDELQIYCELGWDYIGAPWFRDENNPLEGFSRSGNGGLSLRKIDTFLKVLASTAYHDTNRFLNFFEIYQSSFPIDERHFILNHMKRANIARKASRGVQKYLERYRWNEDRFWANQADIFWSAFKLAPVDIGLSFAFEKFPKYCLAYNNNMLPFGCHAWYRYDIDFWKDYLEHE